jgi:type IV pilus assembly protein PilA
MLNAIRKRTERDDEGFTLIELMVVVLIIGILLAIAIPTFLGARDRANDRSAQSNLRNALTAEKTLYTDNQSYTDTATAGPPTGISLLTGVEPSLTWVNATPAKPREVSATVSNGGATVVLEAHSDTGTCFYVADESSPSSVPGTYYSSGACRSPR